MIPLRMIKDVLALVKLIREGKVSESSQKAIAMARKEAHRAAARKYLDGK